MNNLCAAGGLVAGDGAAAPQAVLRRVPPDGARRRHGEVHRQGTQRHGTGDVQGRGYWGFK